jgi:hypothetical protein
MKNKRPSVVAMMAADVELTTRAEGVGGTQPVATPGAVTYNFDATRRQRACGLFTASGKDRKGVLPMRNLVIVIAVFLLLSSTAFGAWYGGPVYGYYAAAPVVVPAPYVVYSPIVTAPTMVPAPVMVPGPYAAPMAVAAPVVVGRPVVVGPAGKVYIVGRPVRNAVRAVLP